MPPGPDLLPLATSALRTSAQERGFGVFAPIPATGPPFVPLLDVDGTLDVRSIQADAYANACQHALDLPFREIATQWIAANSDNVRVAPPLSDRECFGF